VLKQARACLKLVDICSILGLVIAIPLAIIAVREWMKNEALSMNWGLFWISFIALLMFAAGALQVWAVKARHRPLLLTDGEVEHLPPAPFEPSDIFQRRFSGDPKKCRI
jgi:hypothetical protein